MNASGFLPVPRALFAGDPFWGERREFSRWEAWIDLQQLETNWPAVDRLATSLVQEEDLPGDRVAELLLGLGVHQGRIPVRLELPVGETSSAEELRRAIEELETFRGGIDHLQDQRWVDYHLELVRSWLARKTAGPAGPQQPRHGNGRRS